MEELTIDELRELEASINLEDIAKEMYGDLTQADPN